MKIYNETKLTVVGKAEPTFSQDGRNKYYRVAAMQNGQATNLSVPEEIDNEIPDGGGLIDVIFATVYDDKYGSFRVDRLLHIVAVNGRPYDSKTAPASAPEKAAK